MTVKTAQRLFLVAGIYGVLVVAPLFFLEQAVGDQNPPAITHPEFYYGFASVTLVWQFVYLMMWRDPLRYRPILIPATIGKVGFAASVVLLFLQQRVDVASVIMASIDLVIAGLFVWAYVGLAGQQPPGSVS